MAGSQPSASPRTESANIEDTLSDASISRDTSEILKRDGLHPKEAYETYKRLQSDYDELLTKYAQAENTIDQLRIGAKLNLYSDLPAPQKSSFVTVPSGKHPQIFNFPRPSQANLSTSSNVVTVHSNGTANDSYYSRTPESDKNESDLLTPEVRAEGIRTSLMFKLPTLQENVEELQSHVADDRWGESELRELQDVCNQLMRQHGNMKRELMQAKQLEKSKTSSDGNISLDGDFLHEDDLEGQLYRLGLRLDEINEQIDQNLHQIPGNEDSDSTITSRNPAREPAKRQYSDPKLSDLAKRLQDVKESAKKDDALSRNLNSLENVEDLKFIAGNEIQGKDQEHDFTLGPLSDDSDEDKNKKRDSHNGGMDLQESGYFASETMSLSVGNDNSDPISTYYLSNSASGLQHPLGERDHDTSFDQQSLMSSHGRERPLSDTSVESRPNSRRSRRTSQRSRSSTLENPAANPMTYYPEYHSPPSVEPSPPQASSSILTDQTRHQPRAERKESRVSNSNGVRPHADSHRTKDPETRHTKPKTRSSEVNILRTEYDNPDQYRDRKKSRDNDISPRGPSGPAESPETSPRQDIKAGNQRKPGRQRTSLSSADSRVSTPLFHPGARPKDTRRQDKTRPPTAETERGFDSGFFGSEGSRTSRFIRAPLVPPSANKLIHPSVREHTVTESEGERYRAPATNSPIKSSKRDLRRRRSYLQSLSESDEDRGLESSPNVRSSASQRERRGHRHTPTFPATRSDNERARRFDGSLRRHSSSPNIFEQVNRTQRVDPLRSSRSQARSDPMRRSVANLEQSARVGPRSDNDRPMDKQSMRSYPGMDRESVRSGRRSRRDEDSTSGYSDGDRKHKRDRVDKLQDELQHLRAQLQEESSARNLQAEMYGDLRRKHDDLEREIARKNSEQQMKTMYEDLLKKYKELTKSVENPAQPRDTATQVDLSDDLKKRLEDLSLQVRELKTHGLGETNHVRFLCPFCGGCDGHHHGSYFYPGYSGTGGVPGGTPSTPPRIHSMGTQTHFDDGRVPQHTRYPSTPQATSTPYHTTGYHSAPVNHYHTNTYPGGVSTASPIHHIHHLPADGRSRDHYEDDYSSEEEDRYRSRRRGPGYRGTRRRIREMYPEDELDSRRLHLSLDEANKAARRMQRLSKKMLSSVATDLIRSGHR